MNLILYYDQDILEMYLHTKLDFKTGIRKISHTNGTDGNDKVCM